jgi:hypothetical protein
MVQENQATLYAIDQSGPLQFLPIANLVDQNLQDLQDSGVVPQDWTSFQMNNLGFGSADGLLYATMLSYDTDGDPSAPYVFSTPDLLGIFKIDSTGKVVGPLVTSGVTIPDNLRWAAGDVHPDGTKMYISTQYQNNTGDGALYIVDLTQNPASVTMQTIPARDVADWAAHPTERSADGQHAILYAGTRSYLDGVILRLDPQTGTITVVPGSGAIVLPGGVVNNALQAYGGAWFNAVGDLFLYRNEGTVYQIDLSSCTGTRARSTRSTSILPMMSASVRRLVMADVRRSFPPRRTDRIPTSTTPRRASPPRSS